MSDWGDLENVAEAIARGTPLAQLRVTAAVCERDHVLAEVFRDQDGDLHVRHREAGLTVRTTDDEDVSDRWRRMFLTGRGWRVTPLDRRDANGDLLPPMRMRTFSTKCSCAGLVAVPETALRDAVRRGKKRVVVRVLPEAHRKHIV